MKVDLPWCSRGLRQELLDQRPWVVIDVETTGLNFIRDELLEFAAVVMDPRCEEAVAVRVWQADEGLGRLLEIAKGLRGQLARGVVVAHNLDFDIAFLRRHEQMHTTGLAAPPRWLCTMKATGAYVSLDVLAGGCGVQLRDRHTAVGDAKGLAEIMSSLCAAARVGDSPTIGDLRRVASLRFAVPDGGPPLGHRQPWAYLLDALPHIVPVTFPTPEQRALVAAVNDQLSRVGVDTLDSSLLSRLSDALRASGISVIGLESMLADAGIAWEDT